MQVHAQAQAAQAQSNGMMGMQQGVPGMNPQQMLQFQQNNAGVHQGIQLPQHLAQQQYLRHQQAQAQNQQAQMAAQLAMQQGNSQQSNQGQPGQQNQQGQPGHGGQMRPQSRMANPNEQNQGTPQQQHQQQQQSQQGQGQQQNPQQGQQVGQQGQPTPQQLQVLHQRQQAATMQRQMQTQRQMQQLQAQAQLQQAQQQQQSHPGTFILRVMQFGDQLSNYNPTNGKDIAQWQEFVGRHFAPEGRLLHSFEEDGKGKTYEVLRPTIAQYFWSYFESGAYSLRLHTEHSMESQQPNGGHSVICNNTTLTIAYPNGARLEVSGILKVLFARGNDLIECLEIHQTGTEEVLVRSEIEKVLSNWSPTMGSKNASPKMTNKKLPKAQQKLQQQLEGLTIESFPKVPKGMRGVTARVEQFLEVGE